MATHTQTQIKELLLTTFLKCYSFLFEEELIVSVRKVQISPYKLDAYSEVFTCTFQEIDSDVIAICYGLVFPVGEDAPTIILDGSSYPLLEGCKRIVKTLDTLTTYYASINKEEQS